LKAFIERLEHREVMPRI